MRGSQRQLFGAVCEANAKILKNVIVRGYKPKKYFIGM